MLLVYPRGVRVIIHTANLIYVDWNNKSQGLWMQDFPWKIQKELSKGCAFENDLIDYLNELKVLVHVKILFVFLTLKEQMLFVFKTFFSSISFFYVHLCDISLFILEMMVMNAFHFLCL